MFLCQRIQGAVVVPNRYGYDSQLPYENRVSTILAQAHQTYLTTLHTTEAAITAAENGASSGYSSMVSGSTGKSIRTWCRANGVKTYKLDLLKHSRAKLEQKTEKDNEYRELRDFIERHRFYKSIPYFFAIQFPRTDTLVWLSTRPVNIYHYKDIVSQTKKTVLENALDMEHSEGQKKILILTGTHGDKSGGTAQNRRKLGEEKFYNDAVSMFHKTNQDKALIEIVDLSQKEDERFLDAKVVSGVYQAIILTWCWSDSSYIINQLFSIPVQRPVGNCGDYLTAIRQRVGLA